MLKVFFADMSAGGSGFHCNTDYVPCKISEVWIYKICYSNLFTAQPFVLSRWFFVTREGESSDVAPCLDHGCISSFCSSCLASLPSISICCLSLQKAFHLAIKLYLAYLKIFSSNYSETVRFYRSAQN